MFVPGCPKKSAGRLTMFAFLQQPYVFAAAMALITAGLVYAYSMVTDRDGERSRKTFFKTLAAGVLAGAVLTYAAKPRAEALATEPFDVPVGLPAAGGGGI
jgi:hypothetical protein